MGEAAVTCVEKQWQIRLTETTCPDTTVLWTAEIRAQSRVEGGGIAMRLLLLVEQEPPGR